MHTACSGKLTPEIAYQMIGAAFGRSLPETWFASYRACDIDAVCQHLALESDRKTTHVFVLHCWTVCPSIMEHAF